MAVNNVVVLEVHRWAECPVRHKLEYAMEWKTPIRHGPNDPRSVLLHFPNGKRLRCPSPPKEEVYLNDNNKIYQVVVSHNLDLPAHTFAGIRIKKTQKLQRTLAPFMTWEKKGPYAWDMTPLCYNDPPHYTDHVRQECEGPRAHTYTILSANDCRVNWVVPRNGVGVTGEFREARFSDLNSKGKEEVRFYKTTVIRSSWRTEECNSSWNPGTGWDWGSD